jgi:hypothetical protein
MTNKNSVYTVTPPDLTLITIGPSILLMGVSLADASSYSDIYDKLLPEVEITLYVSESGYADEFAPWFRAVTGMVSSIFIDIDNSTTEEVFLAMQAENDERTEVYWVSTGKAHSTMVSLLNSYQYRVFCSLEEISHFLEQEYGTPT